MLLLWIDIPVTNTQMRFVEIVGMICEYWKHWLSKSPCNELENVVR